MNERLKELADQASVTFIITKGVPEIVDGCYVTSDAHLQKFAELIIKECREAVEDLDHGSSDEWDRALRVASANIREHFGVTE